MDGMTKSAGVKLWALLKCVKAPAKKCVRMVEELDGQTLKLGEQRPDDEVFEYEGRTVLVIDSQMAKKHVGQKLDWQHGQFCFV